MECLGSEKDGFIDDVIELIVQVFHIQTHDVYDLFFQIELEGFGKISSIRLKSTISSILESRVSFRLSL